ncbi:putative NRPS-like protein biosynthetic cluster [Fusarium musae]|uniref:NRPS-like protein biosynthetic cluster n=1 Tax=Fusarium musae TaxID=1042133 RepID=A0A9P8DTM8_9HYPO|nr:putative NRPS-like protein biosynthetic cluster [Fusarium musae]KAG9508149.1 putative NRPS-like protein biosynthetic cluster [Fusarium musae]
MTMRANIEHHDAPVSGGASNKANNAIEKSQINSESDVKHHVLIDLIHEIATNDPDRVFTYTPSSSDTQDGWKPVTHLHLANAVDYLAHDISKTVAKSSDDEVPTVAYIGPNDFRYTAILLACVKAGCKALFISPRNTPAVQLSLFETTDCRYLYTIESFKSAMQSCLDQRTMEVAMIESIDTLLNVTPKPFPYSRTVEQARWDPLVVLHTSGSTGVPKPVFLKQGILYALEDYLTLPNFHGSPYTFNEWAERASKIFMGMPMYHAAGTYLPLTFIYTGLSAVMPFPNQPLNVDTAMDYLKHSGADGAMLPPSVVDELAATEEGTEALAKLKLLITGGGSLSTEAGNMLAERGVVLRNVISSTDPQDPKLWRYFIFNSEVMGIVWQRHDSNEYELVVRRKASDPDNQGCFYNFPELSEWRTSDIFEPHPTLKDHWLYKGRADDIIVFSNGEKLNPVTIEGIVSDHPLVKSALVVGQKMFQAALIIEPVAEAQPKDDTEAKALLDKVWPTIEKANAETVTHGRIAANFVAFADPALPFARADKGTVQRGKTVNLYADFISALYEKAEMLGVGDGPAIALDLSDDDTLTGSIIDLFVTKLGVEKLEPDTDFFSVGVDSLQVMTATNLLRGALHRAGVDTSPITPRIIYRNPTAKVLAKYIRSLRSGASDDDEETQEINQIKAQVAKYTKNLPVPRTGKQAPLDDGQTVIVTGTTGSLGAYMLDQLCRLESVKKIISLNRSDDGGISRQPSINEYRGLTTDFSKVEFLHANLSLPDFGLGQSKYDSLLADVDRVIHNAWPVNFKFTMSSFESHVRGVRHLVDFSSAASKNVPIIFISSIGTVDRWSSPDAVHEEALHDLSLPSMAYGRSKLAASLILDAAAEQSGVPTVSVRVGQIAGSRGEKVYLGVLPDHLGGQQEIAWTPIEDIAGLILDVAGITVQKSISEISGYFHGVNPATTSWSDIAPAVKDFYGNRMKVVSVEKWVEKLEASSKEENVDFDKNPGVKLLDSYRGLYAGGKDAQPVKHGMERTTSHSPTMRELGPITPELMRNWCRQWGF